MQLKDGIITGELKICLPHKKIVFHSYEANSNVVFICQKNFAQVLINELGLNDVNNITATYTKASKMISNIVSENCIISEKII